MLSQVVQGELHISLTLVTEYGLAVNCSLVNQLTTNSEFVAEFYIFDIQPNVIMKQLIIPSLVLTSISLPAQDKDQDATDKAHILIDVTPEFPKSQEALQVSESLAVKYSLSIDH